MPEIHFYFTPLLDELADFIHEKDWYLHPMVNLSQAMLLRDLANLPKTTEALNACYDRLYKISLDFLTVNLHGRKTGRHFLLLLQEMLKPGDVLAYNDLMRNQILHQLGVSAADFKAFRPFSKTTLLEGAQDFYHSHFSQTPAGIVVPAHEELHIDACDQLSLQHYLYANEKTA